MEERYLNAGRAAEELGVSLATLYAYVNRGMVRSEAVEGKRRNRRYRAEDVRRLKERKRRRRDPDGVVEDALHWGTPVLESGITLIEGGGLYYKGRNVVALAEERRIEEVAALVWTGDETVAPELFPSGPSGPSRRVLTVVESVAGLSPVEVWQVILPVAAAEDPAAYDLRPGAVTRTGARILRLMTDVVVGSSPQWVSGTLQRGWRPEDPGAAELLDTALVFCVDHELPVSTFAARCVASSEATPYAVVLAGLAALGGVKHGGEIELVEAFLREVEAAGDARAVISGRLRRGERIPGFGHSLYPEGDPRRRSASSHSRGLSRECRRGALRYRCGRDAAGDGRTSYCGLRAGDGGADSGVAPGRGRRALRPRQNCGLDRPRHRAVQERLPHTTQSQVHRRTTPPNT